MAENEKIELPPKYYLEYFNFVLDFVKDKYKHILEEKEWRFLRKYYALTEDAQCLFIRFTNRKGLFFKIEGLNYKELSPLDELIPVLNEKGFLEYLDESHQIFTKDVLNLLNKSELNAIFKEKSFKSLKKEDHVQAILTGLPNNEIIQATADKVKIVKLNFEFETAFIRFLFFGNRSMDMSEFVVRDLGLIQYYQHDDDKLVARFNTRKDAEDKWIITDFSEIFETLCKTASNSEVFDWFLNMHKSIGEISEVALPALDRLVLRSGQFFERQKEYEKALEIFKLTTSPPARERRVRCLHKLNLTEEALALCTEMVEKSVNADEHFFGKDFAERMLTKSRKNKKLTTQKLQEAESITISKEYRGNVEMGTMMYYIKQGKKATFAENYLWRAIFGLIFWDIIFDPNLVAFHHPFQRRPSDMYLPDFYEKRAEQIVAHLDQFVDLQQLLQLMGSNYEKNEGIANAFVVWVDEMWDMVHQATTVVGLEKIKDIMHRIARNIVENSRGFPDIFVWDENGYEFIEVKSPTDNLSNRQLYWLGYFEENGINARVLRVYFD